MSSLSLLGDLLRSYFFNATAFFVLHLVVIGSVIQTYLRLRREKRSLNDWSPGAPGYGAAAVLAAFVEDSARLGTRGFIVPLTDYSDRLDAQVQNIVDELNERTSMLLIVGIAGTIFGIFEFAARVIHVSSGDRLAEIASILALSVAKAFPVGFIGLLLMMAAQLLLAGPMERLDRAARTATQRALQFRGDVSRTLADSIADSIGASIGEAMEPVATLGATISEHLQPVVATLGTGLEQSLSLVRSQFGEIDRSTQRFIDATGNLEDSSTALTETAANLGNLLKTTPAVLAKTQELQELQRSALEMISGSFQRNLQLAAAVAESLQRVQASTEEIPQQLVARTAEALAPTFESLARESAETWSHLIGRLAADLQHDYAAFVGQAKSDIGGIHDEIRGAAQEWHRLAGESETMVSQPLARALDSMTAASERVLTVTGSLAESLRTVEANMLRLPEELVRQTAAAVEPAFERIASQSVDVWSELVRSVAVDLQRDYTAYVASAREEVMRTNVQLNAAAEELQRVAQNTQAFLTEPIKTAIETARREATGILTAVDEFVREQYPGLKIHLDEFGKQMQASANAFATVEQKLRHVPLEQRSDPETVGLLRDIRELLRRSQAVPASSTAVPAMPIRPRQRVGWLHRLLPHHWFQRP